jgi:hypothetical protein
MPNLLCIPENSGHVVIINQTRDSHVVRFLYNNKKIGGKKDRKKRGQRDPVFFSSFTINVLAAFCCKTQ